MESLLRERVSLRRPTHLLALGFGSGLSRNMPGTMGTLAALPLVVALAFWLPLWAYILVCVIGSLGGIYVCGKTADDMGIHDHPSIVWDEFAGIAITLIAVPLNPWTVVAGFIAFRVLDILKPWPIKHFDQHLHGGLGIMLDDVLAGLAACGLLHAGLALVS
ncbi:phosphatidylglycerophosphatase A [Aestuariibacter halophilus]|uniref:Phosphatidylglycerophosphatase A n=1 Tax=Fluctibacter halophilus TaxID=226011 RepID=A0ABS8G3M4_9ALTE|nr:phosphatidylglycerophosphatase A [Aestuariibacter halophilus]MCC2614726.1 phosphatidylglycerophosphatase A [Aestuariibacter halophilus]